MHTTATSTNRHLADAIACRDLFQRSVAYHDARGSNSLRAVADREGLLVSEIHLGYEQAAERLRAAGAVAARATLAAEVKADVEASTATNGCDFADTARLRWARLAAAGW